MKTQSQQGQTTQTAGNAAMIRDFYKLVQNNDWNSARQCLDDQIEWVEANTPGLWFAGAHHGPDGVYKEVIEPTFGKLDSFRMDLERTLESGDNVIVTGRFRGRGKTSGRELSAPFAHVWEIRNGKARRFQGYTDTAQWLQVIKP